MELKVSVLIEEAAIYVAKALRGLADVSCF